MAKHANSKEVDDGKACAVLAYLLIGIIWYFVDEKMKRNAYVKHHVQQGLVLLVASIAYSIVLGIVMSIILVPLMFTGAAGLGIMSILSLLYWIPVIWTIIGIVHAVQGNTKDLPVIGHFGRKLRI
jgi:uncharacterized membrane protein